MKSKLVKLDAISLDGDTQPRTEIDQDLVMEYAAAYQSGVEMPPLDVFFDGAKHWLADGFHRWHAARQAGIAKVSCLVRNGTLTEARWFSYAANQTHGLRRKNEDKRKATIAALKHPNGAKLSDSQIAEHVGVDHKTVLKYRAEMESSWEIPKIATRTVTRAGTTYEQNTANIGRKAVAEEHEEEDRHDPTDDFELTTYEEPKVEDKPQDGHAINDLSNAIDKAICDCLSNGIPQPVIADQLDKKVERLRNGTYY